MAFALSSCPLRASLKQNSLSHRSQSFFIRCHTISKSNVGLLVNRQLFTAHNLKKQISTGYSIKVASFFIVCFQFIGSFFEIRQWSLYSVMANGRFCVPCMLVF